MTLTTANLSVIYMKCGGSSFVFTSENPEEKKQKLPRSVCRRERTELADGGRESRRRSSASVCSFVSFSLSKKETRKESEAEEEETV